MKEKERGRDREEGSEGERWREGEGRGTKIEKGEGGRRVERRERKWKEIGENGE